MGVTAEILCLGNELLIGRTVNTNANYLAKKLTQLGIDVKRITTIEDELEIATRTLKEILNKEPAVICISGGLGPTHDDIQLAVVAQAMDRDMELNEQALSMVAEKYEELNESRKKMARLPRNSIPLHNSQGSAPGVHTIYNDVHIFSLPGVPREMKAIFEEEIISILQDQLESTSKLIEFGIDIRGARESDISDITDNLREKYGRVNFKSHPKKDEVGYYLSLHTYIISDIEELVKEALVDWKNAIARKYNIIELSDVKKYFEP